MIRQLHELALRYGRSKQSKQTGFVHLCYHPEDEEKHDTIPIAENFLFALALLQSRTSEQILEARTLLEKLLHFQSPDGNFPVYLHEYPQCRDRFVGAHILPALYWMLKIFNPVLGNEFLPKLTQATESLLKFNLRTHKEKPAPHALAIKIRASAKALGDLWNSSELSSTQIPPAEVHSAWFCPASIGDLLIGLQMIYPSISSPWKPFWSHLSTTWHQKTGAYCGPPLREFQHGFEPQPTLYDLYLGYFSGELSQRALLPNPFHLQAALITQTEDKLLPQNLPYSSKGAINDCQWQLEQNESHAFTLFEQREPGRFDPDRGRQIFRLVWGNKKRAHTFICQGGNSSLSTYQIQNGIIEFLFHLEETISFEDREKNREVTFFFDIPDNAEILIQGSPATTFQLDDPIEIHSGGLKFSLQFSLEKGEGQFFGHLMPGNRPSQLALKGTQKFSGYDWQLFLRTVRRTGPCVIKVKMQIHL